MIGIIGFFIVICVFITKKKDQARNLPVKFKWILFGISSLGFLALGYETAVENEYGSLMPVVPWAFLFMYLVYRYFFGKKKN